MQALAAQILPSNQVQPGTPMPPDRNPAYQLSSGLLAGGILLSPIHVSQGPALAKHPLGTVRTSAILRVRCTGDEQKFAYPHERYHSLWQPFHRR